MRSGKTVELSYTWARQRTDNHIMTVPSHPAQRCTNSLDTFYVIETPSLKSISILIQLLMPVGNQVAEFMVEILCGMDHTVNARN